MSEAETSGSSLLLAQEHAAQREHSHEHSHSHARAHAQRSHQQFHRSPHWKDPLGQLEDSTTDVVTISIIQQINVDINGNTLGIETIQTHLSKQPEATSASLTETLQATAPAEPTATSIDASPPSIPSLPSESAIPSLTSSSVSLDPTTTALPSTTSELAISSTVAGIYSSIPGFNAASVDPSPPSISTTNFSSLIATSNSTTLISSSSSLSQTYTNSSTSTKTSLSYIRSSRSTSLFTTSTDSASLLSSTSIDYLATATNGGIQAAGTGGTNSDIGSSTTTDASSSSNNSDSSPTPTPVVIGGVVGSLAGAAVLIICLLYIIRWRKRSRGMLSLGNGNDAGDASRDQPPMPTSAAMAEQTPRGFAVPAALAALTGYSKRFSQKSEGPVSPAAGGERGFYRVSGRKLPSVLQTGGDGYGGGIPKDNTLSGSSFYTDSHGFYGGGGGPSIPPVPLSQRESAGGIPFMRPSPARTPTQEQSPFAFEAPILPPQPRRPDVLGRSHVSQDGSHTSRFTEEV